MLQVPMAMEATPLPLLQFQISCKQTLFENQFQGFFGNLVKSKKGRSRAFTCFASVSGAESRILAPEHKALGE